ncbi:MAG: Crp/Fnr family transcriptional regulator [Spirochaetales bacterium]|nr:Crp/Fnr family transcriptional regulator [Spirochaetales bacterium]
MNVYKELFRQLSAIEDIPEHCCRSFIENTVVRRLLSGENYIEQGDTADSLPFLYSGLIRKYYTDDEGREFTKFFSQPYEFSGAFISFLKQTPSLFTVEALEDSCIIDIPYRFFQSEMKKHHCWLKVYTISLERFYTLKELREHQLLSSNGMARYLQFKKDFPDLDSKLKQYHIASYLGLTPVSLSRIKAQIGDYDASIIRELE